ncbi:MAG: hypothetical protein DI607_12250 [Sphingomonas hengshuiensis]|nr:MAG: hypothetical protein DI607_12250 [Sphingomonas hengshuiensis]
MRARFQYQSVPIRAPAFELVQKVDSEQVIPQIVADQHGHIARGDRADAQLRNSCALIDRWLASALVV